MHRRNFISNLSKLSLGTALGLTHLNPLFATNETTFQPYKLNLSSKISTKKYHDNDLDFFIRDALNLKTTSFAQGQGKFGFNKELISHIKKYNNYEKHVDVICEGGGILNFFNEIPKIMTTPCVDIYLDDYGQNYYSSLQCFRNKYGRLFSIVKHDKLLAQDKTIEDYVLLLPSFNSMIMNPKYRCYGVPTSRPIINRCKDCNKPYLVQIFGHSPIPDECEHCPDDFLYYPVIYESKCEYSPTGTHRELANPTKIFDCNCYPSNNKIKSIKIDRA